ncbi:MAG: hypothetical protein MUE84_11655 [Hyphomonas sp.]|nr:hypothetical protein [Hyphomonas sp.]
MRGQVLRSVPGQEKEGHAAFGQHVGDGINPFTAKVSIENREIYICSPGGRLRICKRCRDSNDICAEGFQLLRQIQCDKHLILDNQHTEAGDPVAYGRSSFRRQLLLEAGRAKKRNAASNMNRPDDAVLMPIDVNTKSVPSRRRQQPQAKALP